MGEKRTKTLFHKNYQTDTNFLLGHKSSFTLASYAWISWLWRLQYQKSLFKFIELKLTPQNILCFVNDNTQSLENKTNAVQYARAAVESSPRVARLNCSEKLGGAVLNSAILAVAPIGIVLVCSVLIKHDRISWCVTKIRTLGKHHDRRPQGQSFLKSQYVETKASFKPARGS